jgi:heterodisulfide reductase subunit A-like polyferredoxin
LTNSELLELEGEEGRFKAKILKQPRYIDTSKCTSCAECAKVCPVSLPNEYDEGLSCKKATYKQYAQAIPGAFAIQKADTAPCRLACPGGLNVQGYVQMVKEGKYKEALEIIMEDLPLPGVLGRICPHGCEDACRRCEVDQPVAIRDLKRLAADKVDPREIAIACEPCRPEKIAIIGSGPAGLSCAYHLARKGILSTIFEALPQPGGMLRVGIPAHRLPREVLDREIEVITNLGVAIQTNTALGSDITVDALLKDGYKAVYLALGAHKGIELGVPGEKAGGVRQGVDFLREANLTGKTPVGKKVAIIGGGNVAIDVSRSAVRLGAEQVTIIYRRTRAEMPAWEEEIQAAESEGAKIEYLAAPQEILTRDGQVVGVRCIRMELTEADSSGRRRPVPIPGSEFEFECDQLVPAIGQRPDLSSIENLTGLTFSRYGTVEVNAVSYATERPGVFAGGDLQSGPWVAIGAIGAGKEAAESILRYLDGRDLVEGREAAVNENPLYRPVPEGEPRRARAMMPHLPVEKRRGNFDEVELGFEEGAGKAEAGRCLNCGYCCECYQCVKACLANAVDHSQKPEILEVEVGSVVLCPGSEPYDPSKLENIYHYKASPNVVTSLEFERLLSASGPTMGHLKRPSDDKEPKRVAWLQCIGSRDTNQCGNGYCSSVCCMYAIKDSMIAKEHAHGDLDCVVFNMDIRSFGKDYEKYYNRAKDAGIRFVKCRVHSLDVVPETGDLSIRFVDEAGNLMIETFDMVVLSVGLQVPESTVALAKRLKIEVNESRFAVTQPFAPVETTRRGVYACGVFQGPKDIPGSVTEASAAACAAASRLASGRNSLTRRVELPAEIDVSNDLPRVGVFVCNCGVNISSVVKVKEVEEYAKNLPGVVYSTQNLFTCSQDSQEQMKTIIRENRLNRVVVAACSPKTHQPIFQDTLTACGLNKHLFDMANIRNQDSWVHSAEPAAATRKAKDLVRAAVARAATLKSITGKEVPITKRALVIGGGIAGMNAALSLAGQGFPVVLVEKQAELGGFGRNLHHTIEGADIQTYLKDLIAQVKSNANIEILANARVTGFSGFKGNFTTEVAVGPEGTQHTIDHGAIILATGAAEYRPKEYLYGEDPRVLTQVELGQRLQRKDLGDPKQVVMIQCIGSRNEENPNCSRICCQTAVKNALYIREHYPETDVFILYRDIRTYGLMEKYYTEARRRGVLFFRFDPERPPKVEKTANGIEITFVDHILQRPLLVSPDLLVLSAGMQASDTAELSGIVKAARTQEGFFMEAHVKLRPVDMAADGFYVCGTAHGPKLISETIAQAQAAAARAGTLLALDSVSLSAITAKVITEYCVKCLTCVRSCPFGVPQFNTEEKVIEINEALCRGCGVCTAVCPRQTINLSFYEDDQIMCKIDALLAEEVG